MIWITIQPSEIFFRQHVDFVMSYYYNFACLIQIRALMLFHLTISKISLDETEFHLTMCIITRQIMTEALLVLDSLRSFYCFYRPFVPLLCTFLPVLYLFLQGEFLVCRKLEVFKRLEVCVPLEYHLISHWILRESENALQALGRSNNVM